MCPEEKPSLNISSVPFLSIPKKGSFVGDCFTRD
jgi:hypothetical protein